MIYDTKNRIEKQQAISRFHNLLENEKKIELKEKHPRRSINQNSYLHLLLNAFGLQFGYNLQEVKQRFFKELVNPELFYEGEHGNLEKIERWRSTAELNTKELTTAINKFLDYSANNGYRLPEPSDLVWIEELEKEIENNKRFL